MGHLLYDFFLGTGFAEGIIWSDCGFLVSALGVLGVSLQLARVHPGRL